MSRVSETKPNIRIPMVNIAIVTFRRMEISIIFILLVPEMLRKLRMCPDPVPARTGRDHAMGELVNVCLPVGGLCPVKVSQYETTWTSALS